MKTVLLVDDQADFLICAKNFLNVYAEQLNVLVASNGQQALEILNANPVDLLVTDIKMPVMDGVELLTHLSRKHLDISVIVITAFATKYFTNKFRMIDKWIAVFLKSVYRVISLYFFCCDRISYMPFFKDFFFC